MKKQIVKILILTGVILLIILGFWLFNPYKQEQYTITVTPINKGLNNLSVNSLIASYPSVLYIGTEGGVFKSIDRGDNWFPINEGLGSFNKIKKLQHVEDIESNKIIYLLTAGVLFRSENDGIEWKHIIPLSCVQNGEKIIFPTIKDFFISDAEPVSWETAVYALTYGEIPPEEIKEGKVWQVYDKVYVANHKFLRGCDLEIDYLCEEGLCQDWFSSPYFRNYSFDSPVGGLEKIFVLDEYEGIILGEATAHRFYISKNRGESWQQFNFNDSGENISILDLKPAEWYTKEGIKYIYASIKTENGKIFLKSRDYGNTWEELSKGEKVPEVFITKYFSGSGAYITGFSRIGRDYYLVRSITTAPIDSGKSWKISENSLPEEIVNNALMTDLPLSVFLSGVFVSDPELKDVLYIGTKNRGVLRIDVDAKK